MHAISASSAWLHGLPCRATTQEVQRLEESGQPVARREPGFDVRPPDSAKRVLSKWQQTERVAALPDRSTCQHVLGEPDADQRVILFLEPTYSDAGGMWEMLTQLAKPRKRCPKKSARIEL